MTKIDTGKAQATNHSATVPQRSRLTLLLGLASTGASAACTTPSGQKVSREEEFQIWAREDTRKVKAKRDRDARVRKYLADQAAGGEGGGGGGGDGGSH